MIPENTYGYSLLSIEDKLDKNGSVQEHTERQFETVLLDGHPFRRLVSKNGKPVTEMTRKKRRSGKRSFARTSPIPSQRRTTRMPLNSTRVGLTIQLQRSKHGAGEWAAGLFCSLFFPARSTHCREKRVDRVVNRLEGKVWITKSCSA